MSVIYNGLKKLVDPKTGEIYHVRSVIKTAPIQQFRRVQLMDLLISLGVIGGKSILVYSYILNHIGTRTNKLYQTNKQIQQGMANEHHKVSLHTIMRVVSKLRHTKDSSGRYILKRKRYGKYGRHSYLMLNPGSMAFGKTSHVNGLLLQYNQLGNRKHRASAKTRRARVKARKKSDAKAIQRGWTVSMRQCQRLRKDGHQVGYQMKLPYMKKKQNKKSAK